MDTAPPSGDTRGLFVPTETARCFRRESQGGRSTVSFDYRIVATALGHGAWSRRSTDGGNRGRAKREAAGGSACCPRKAECAAGGAARSAVRRLKNSRFSFFAF